PRAEIDTESPRNPSRAGGAAMAKNRNKKNNAKKGAGGVAAMDTSDGGPVASTAAAAPQPMDTSEGNLPSSTSMALGSINKKIKKGVQMKRSQNARK
ncbi:unnamed protein product, partial [Urochloa humidicola]